MVPYAYDITPWSVLFPDLKLKLPQSFTSIYYAKIYMYYLTRLQFSQYLYFLQDIGTSISKYTEANAVYDADIYCNHCNDLLKKISRLDKADEKIYDDIVTKFNESLLSDGRFKDIIIYNKFYELYNFMNDCLSMVPVLMLNQCYWKFVDIEHDFLGWFTKSDELM
ncbi:hypothetical protein GMJAKD_08190 [Candidatus Electrothrix aarhusensis]